MPRVVGSTAGMSVFNEVAERSHVVTQRQDIGGGTSVDNGSCRIAARSGTLGGRLFRQPLTLFGLTTQGMVFELHVWGPAFGLPSIDAECIAAIAHFNRVVPQGQWSLVANYDTSISPRGA